MQQKRSDLWEQRKLSVKAKYLDVTLNFFTCKRKTVNENNWDMDAHLILFGTRLHTDKPIWILWISIVFILERNRFYYSKTDCIGMRSRAPLNFTGHLRFWLQKYFVQNWRELFTRKKFTAIIFRNFMKLSRWKRKMKIWENCNANGKMTKNKCVSYWSRDISSWSLEEKLHWYNIIHGMNLSLSIQLWQSVTWPALRRKGILRIESVLHQNGNN